MNTKNFIINYLGQKSEGEKRRRELIEKAVENDGFFPQPVHVEDIDRGFKTKIESEWALTIKGDKVPIIPIQNQKFVEFAKNWQFSDLKKNLKPPFLGFSRRPDAQPGTNLNGLHNIPDFPSYTLYKVPKIINGKKRTILYQIPQPIQVDITYDIFFISNRQREVNLFNEHILRLFSSGQYYMETKGHYMPIYRNTISEEDENSMESRNFFRQSYEVVIKGYLLLEQDFKKRIVSENISITTEVDQTLEQQEFTCTRGKQCQEGSDVQDVECPVCFNFRFKRNQNTSSTIVIQEDIEFLSNNQRDGNPITVYVNGNSVNLPFTVGRGDELFVEQFIDTRKPVIFQICGELR